MTTTNSYILSFDNISLLKYNILNNSYDYEYSLDDKFSFFIDTELLEKFEDCIANFIESQEEIDL